MTFSSATGDAVRASFSQAGWQGIVAGCVSLGVWASIGAACTLTANDYEPELVRVSMAEPAVPDVAAPSSDDRPDAASAACDTAGGCCGTQPGCADTEVCVDGECVAPSCSGEEGSEACPVALCTTPDCEAAPVSSGPQCNDDQRNGTEADIDCGIDCPERCPPGSSCGQDADCTTLECTQGRCGASCEDCGGDCPACPLGSPCEGNADCASRSCGADGLCAVASCSDGLLNQDEAGVDCGGGCPPCASVGCRFDRDCDGTACGRDNCAAGLDQCCQPASCSDGLIDGLETDVDCGGPASECRRCPEGLRCASDGDCASGACEAGQCCGGTLGNCTRCAERLSRAQDCSGAGPGGEGSCSAFLQCLANNRSLCATRYAPGCSSDPGACNHNFYGGDGSVGIQQANAVIFDAGCRF